MSAANVLWKPEECTMLLVDFQAGLGFGVESIPRQLVVNNAVGLARPAVTFKVPVIASTSASRVYSGPLLPALQEALPAEKPIERRSMNVWEDDTARNAVVATNRRRLIVAGFLTEACVSFPALSALKDGFEVFVVGDACGGLTPQSHELALRRLEQAGARLTSFEYKFFWNSSVTGPATKRTRPREPLLWRMAGAMEWVSRTREMIHPG